MFDQNALQKLQERYKDLHPLLFHRSVERAKSLGDLFDILDTVPKKLPVVWCEHQRRWVREYDLFLIDQFFIDK